ncbi:hypothetical protein QQM39_43180 [Streptomyces sp. DT2A-34]|nr:hypothetical protein [Streptomyces sp. DT2A-34]MDO0917364.1 hypothetical protein [Streptomyces sp. DT2A-34]
MFTTSRMLADQAGSPSVSVAYTAMSTDSMAWDRMKGMLHVTRSR